VSAIHRCAACLLVGALTPAALCPLTESVAAPRASGDSALTRCTRARIGPRIECLAVGTRCNPRYNHAYGSYGFVCRRTADGSYRLHQRIFQGPPVPAPNATV
jgi:hypothetical protein